MTIAIILIIALAVLVGLITWWIDGRGKIGLAFAGMVGIVATLIWLALDAFLF